MSGRSNMRDHAERGLGSGGRGSGQFADGGSRPDLCEPADREERTEISPPVKSMLGLVGMYPAWSPELNKGSGDTYGWFLEMFGETFW